MEVSSSASKTTREVLTVHKKKEQKKIGISFACFNLGVFFFWSAFFALGNLQSSINIEGGLGTATLGAKFLTSVLCGVCLAPVAIKRFGAKICLIISDFSLLPFILANFYPTYYTLLPAGVVMAILQSPMWPSMSKINVLFASEFTGVSKRSKDLHVIAFSGYFFTSFQASQVFGSLISYAILYGIDQTPIPEVATAVNCTANANESCTATNYGHCGVNDCQNAAVIEEAMSKYEPVDPSSFYILIGITLLFEIIAILVHAFLLPADANFEEKRQQYEAAMLAEKESKSAENKELLLVEQCDSDNIENTEVNEENKVISSGHLIADTVKSVFKHTFSAKLLLLLPITIYNGLAMAFATSELTRSMASCILGVQWVGICMAVFALSDSILSWAVGKYGRKIRRIPVFIIAMILECGNYLYCFLWSAGPNLLLSVLAIFFTFGFTNGIFQIIINVTHIDFFPNNPDVAVAVWNVFIEIGLGLGYLLSTAFCVGARIYFNVAVMLVGCIALVAAEIYHQRTLVKLPLKRQPDGRTDA